MSQEGEEEILQAPGEQAYSNSSEIRDMIMEASKF